MYYFENPEFEWDEAKRLTTLEKHGIDFIDAAKVFLTDHIKVRSKQIDEPRWLAIGDVKGHVIAVIYTVRDDRIRLITARHARDDEKRKYYKYVVEGHSKH
jgi:uncharacterized DUF497 family protein